MTFRLYVKNLIVVVENMHSCICGRGRVEHIIIQESVFQEIYFISKNIEP